MNQIIVIGTRPPCPRCKLLGDAIGAIMENKGIQAQLQHYSYTDAEALAIATSLGLTAGTAKDVAAKLGMKLEAAEFGKITPDKARAENKEYAQFNQSGWCVELDEFLRPYQEKAGEAAILMTPVLIINGEVKSSGSLPPMRELDQWLGALV